MNTPRKPAPGAVIIGPLSAKTRQRVERKLSAELESPAGAENVLVANAKSGDPRELWKTINAIVGNEAVVAPLLTDDDGHTLLPTGRFQVRFKSAPGDKALADFAKQHGIALVKRNKWSPTQAEFAISPEDSRFLTDLAAKLAADKAVEAAWPDVRAAFRRESA